MSKIDVEDAQRLREAYSNLLRRLNQIRLLRHQPQTRRVASHAFESQVMKVSKKILYHFLKTSRERFDWFTETSLRRINTSKRSKEWDLTNSDRNFQWNGSNGAAHA